MLIEIRAREWSEFMSTLADLATAVAALTAEVRAAHAEIARLQSASAGLSPDDQATVDAAVEAASAALAGAVSGTPSSPDTATPAPSDGATEAAGAVSDNVLASTSSVTPAPPPAAVTQDNSGV